MTNTRASTNPLLNSTDKLRLRYHEYLASDIEFAVNSKVRQGKVAGKRTRRGIRQAATWADMTHDGWQALQSDWLADPQNLMVWSDLHLGHENIIRYSGRPFGNVFHMNNALLEAAQAYVSNSQWLLFGGDVAMWRDQAAISDWLDQCPGRKALIIGNHDVQGKEHPQSVEEWMMLGFEAVADCFVIPSAHGAPETWTTHYPLAIDRIPQGIINLHGHTHQDRMSGPRVSACLELNDYRPKALLELLEENHQLKQ